MLSRLRIFVILVACVFLTSDAVRSQTPTTSSADETAIRQVVQQVQDGWNAHDGKAFASPFTIDADYVVVNGMKIKGRAEIENGHTRIFSTVYKESHNVGTVQSVRFLRPDVAVVHVEWNLEYTMAGEKKKSRAMNSMVLTKDGGKWSIVAFHNTPIQEQGR